MTHTIPSTYTSQFYEAMSQSPKKSKGRFPNISIAIPGDGEALQSD
jgi:hypothetical protein